MSREARCRSCSEVFPVDTSTGPLPSTCPTCDPEAAARRAEQRARDAAGYRRRAAEFAALRARVAELEGDTVEAGVVVALRIRIAELEHELAAATGPARLVLTEDPRRDLTAAVRRVAQASGRVETCAALLNLRDIAHTFADRLNGGTPVDLEKGLTA